MTEGKRVGGKILSYIRKDIGKQENWPNGKKRKKEGSPILLNL